VKRFDKGNEAFAEAANRAAAGSISVIRSPHRMKLQILARELSKAAVQSNRQTRDCRDQYGIRWAVAGEKC